jgi:hypothetical protein
MKDKNIENKKLPDFLKPLFWDIDFNKLQIDKYDHYIIERIIEYGDDKSIIWMRRNYSPEKIKLTVKNSRCISPNTANLWALVLNISKDEIRCLSIPSIIKQGSFSKS